MRHRTLVGIGLSASLLLAGCQKSGDAEVERALEAVKAVDEASMHDIMLTMADPSEAVAYFTKMSNEQPDRIDFQRGLAQSLVRDKRFTEAIAAWKRVNQMPDATRDDQVDLADALIRANRWDEADVALDAVAPTHETFKRYRLEAMVADYQKDWDKADSFYETAIGLTTRPASVLNNWGYSKLTRGDFGAAERLFNDALKQDGSLFTAKNNLVLARGAQRNYTLPVVPMEQTERALLLHSLALSAVKQGDVQIGKALLREAIDTHPQHFEEAVRSLRALENA